MTRNISIEDTEKVREILLEAAKRLIEMGLEVNIEGAPTVFNGQIGMGMMLLVGYDHSKFEKLHKSAVVGVPFDLITLEQENNEVFINCSMDGLVVATQSISKRGLFEQDQTIIIENIEGRLICES